MVRYRGRFRCKRIIDSWLPVRDPCRSGAGCRCRIHDLEGMSDCVMARIARGRNSWSGCAPIWNCFIYYVERNCSIKTFSAAKKRKQSHFLCF